MSTETVDNSQFRKQDYHLWITIPKIKIKKNNLIFYKIYEKFYNLQKFTLFL